MFDISLMELLVVFLVAMLVLKPKDMLNLLAKLKNLNNRVNPQKLLQENLLDLEEIGEQKHNSLQKNAKKKRRKKS
ncbi:Sec-independent protein translocase subunit TatA/TatB [Candidatus Bandiella euplotis]|uniref:Sec-independent protein translocase protein TatB n=1 Tax=Candidatus Bandiella euplotis TaxID=1664265 RepID=A0ABZ0UK14_9RICK|nr:hypothetical protein [Candidatus Bandiella woodruffii]WPX96458.1 hypothetical protein Bandiella_00572 [Candidatus Bandiella woodruffii]